MNSELSIELPAPISDLVSDEAFENYAADRPTVEFESRLRALSTKAMFPNGIGNTEMAQCCHCGLLLLHNFLELSHRISQNVPTREGSFWHAIMHRIEGDFWNSKYWYQKVGEHPVFDVMAVEGRWDPAEFVDQCEQARSTDRRNEANTHQTAVKEWKALFEFCFQNAKV